MCTLRLYALERKKNRAIEHVDSSEPEQKYSQDTRPTAKGTISTYSWEDEHTDRAIKP